MSAEAELVTVVSAVRALHYQVAYDGRHFNGEHPGCAECGPGWPCRTIQILDRPAR